MEEYTIRPGQANQVANVALQPKPAPTRSPVASTHL